MIDRMKLCDHDYTNDLACLLGYVGHAKRALDTLVKAVVPFWMCFAPSKWKELLRDRTTLVPKLRLDGEELTVVDGSIYLDKRMAARQHK